jgi:hypothetical protein
MRLWHGPDFSRLASFGFSEPDNLESIAKTIVVAATATGLKTIMLARELPVAENQLAHGQEAGIFAVTLLLGRKR